MIWSHPFGVVAFGDVGEGRGFLYGGGKSPCGVGLAVSSAKNPGMSNPGRPRPIHQARQTMK